MADICRDVSSAMWSWRRHEEVEGLMAFFTRELLFQNTLFILTTSSILLRWKRSCLAPGFWAIYRGDFSWRHQDFSSLV